MKSGGGGIIGELNNSQKELFKFHHLVDHPIQILFWIMMNTLGSSIKFNECMWKTTKTLHKSRSFGVAVFDIAQLFTL